MATIAVSNVTEFTNPFTAVFTGKAGEALTNGNCVCFDVGQDDNLLYQVDLDDADRLDFMGIALDTVAAGETVRYIVAGGVTGLTLSGSGAQAPGNPVYTGDEGVLSDASATGAMRIGFIIRNAGNSFLWLAPDYTKGV